MQRLNIGSTVPIDDRLCIPVRRRVFHHSRAASCVLAKPVLLREALVDDRDWRTRRAVSVGEIAALLDGSADGAEVDIARE